jgi:gluconokinase
VVLIVMGVSGSGKTSVGRTVARLLGWAFVEADDYHPPANVAKMARGEALNDGDRWPWLSALNQAAVEMEREGKDVVVTCSALKKVYREVLAKGLKEVQFVFLSAPREVIEARMKARAGHFMKAGMLESQLATLEAPGGDEAMVVETEGRSVEEVARPVVEKVKSDPKHWNSDPVLRIWEGIDRNNAAMILSAVEDGVTPDAIHVLHGWTPLLTAVSMGDLELCRKLVELGADVDQAGGEVFIKVLPTEQAAFCGRLEVLQWLLDQGAKLPEGAALDDLMKEVEKAGFTEVLMLLKRKSGR